MLYVVWCLWPVVGQSQPLVPRTSSESPVRGDPFYLHDGSGQKVLNHTQKPVLALKWLVQLFSCEGDWVFDGLSGAGTIGIL